LNCGILEITKRDSLGLIVTAKVSGVHLNLSSKVGLEESIVNAPLVSLENKNTNNPESEVRFKQLILDL
jgi:hypothetical protein